MKVLFINTLYAPHEIGGAERAVRVLAESLAAQGDEAVVVTLAPDGQASEGEVNGVRVHYVPLFNVGFLHGAKPLPGWRRKLWHAVDSYNPVMGARVRRILAAEQPDLVECNNLQGFSVAAWQAAASLGLPVMQVLHDYYLACPNSTMYRKGVNCGRQCGDCKALCAPRRALSHVPAMVSAVSQRTLTLVAEKGMFAPSAERSVGPTGIRLEHLQGVQRRTAASADEPLVIGYLGRVEHVKGVEPLLEAVAGLPDVRLLVAGGGEATYVDGLKRRFGEASNVEFLGVVNPVALFSRIDLLVVPSLWEEPLTRVIAEAYAVGLPVAVSRIGGMPEIVDEGVTGYVFEAQGAQAIRRVIAGMPRQPLSSPEQVEQRRRKSEAFAVEAVFRRHQGLWERTMARASA